MLLKLGDRLTVGPRPLEACILVRIQVSQLVRFDTIKNMEKFSIEIETPAGWVNYHTILRPGGEKAQSFLKELQEQMPNANLRIVRWLGEIIN